MQQISLAITTYNRLEQTLNSFDKLYSDERISEIVVLDDFSDVDIYKKLEDILKYYPKVRLYRNRSNLQAYYNKQKVVSLCKQDYVILLDSDNIMGVDYLDKIYEQEWIPNKIYAPCKALPHFDYTAFQGIEITKKNAASFANAYSFDDCLNTGNYFFHKQSYLDAFVEEDLNVTLGSEVMLNSYNWLNAGNIFYVVPELQYLHEVHDGSYYMAHAAVSVGLCKNVMDKVSQLK